MNAPRSPVPLAIIRIAYLVGPLLFGVSTWFLHRQGAWTPDILPRALGFLPAIGIVVAIVGIMVVRMFRASATDPVRRASLAIVGWALGEMSALAGGVYYWLAGDARWFVTGVLLLLLSFLLLPLDDAN